MTKEDKELYIGRKIAFFYRDGRFKVEGVINDIQESFVLVEVTHAICSDFYIVGEEYLIHIKAFIFKFL